MASEEALPPLPELIQDMLNNPPLGLIIYKYEGLDALERTIEPMAMGLRLHKTEEQLMFVTDFPKEYIEDGGDIVRRRVYKSTRKMYFWEHRLLILQFRNCNQYCYVDSAIKNELYSSPRGPIHLKEGFSVCGVWPDGYLGLHSAREPVSTISTSYSAIKNASVPPGLRYWPTVAFECRTLSPLSVKYTDFGIDWWFYQSQGLTKIVVVYYIDHEARNITFEKWVCDITPPENDKSLPAGTTQRNSKVSPLTGEKELPASSFKKRCENRVVYTEQSGFGDNPIVLEIEQILCLPKKSETDDDFIITDEIIGPWVEWHSCDGDAAYTPYGESFPILH
jgi:hypothetical protein